MKQPQLHFYDFVTSVRAFSSTRRGGYSEGKYGEFNINHYCGDSEEAIRQNRCLLCQLLQIEDDCLIMPHQVHQTEVLIVDEAFLKLPDSERKTRLEGVDAVMTDLAGVCIGVSTADCIPVLLYDRVNCVSCAVHAGWRGTVKRIVEKAVKAMRSAYGTNPSEIIAQIGPGIHVESFEVGEEVYKTYAVEGFSMETISRKYPAVNGQGIEKWHINLPECNRQQLLASGISIQQISVSPVDTFVQHDSYFSARRLGINSGRIFTGILMV